MRYHLCKNTYKILKTNNNVIIYKKIESPEL